MGNERSMIAVGEKKATMASEKTVMAVIRAARPSFRDKYDMIAFVVHASFLASGYFLTATGPSAFSDTALTSSSTDEVGMDQWNELDGDYAFVYMNPEKGSKKVLVKCLAMNDKLPVDALADGASEPVHLEISVGDFVGENVGNNYSSHFKNLEKLVKSLDTQILTKLDGSSQPASSINASSSEANEMSITARHSLMHAALIPYHQRDDLRWFGLGGGQPGVHRFDPDAPF